MIVYTENPKESTKTKQNPRKTSRTDVSSAILQDVRTLKPKLKT